MAEVSLTAEQINELNLYRLKLDQLASEIARAKRAGIDVTDLETYFTQLETLRSGLLKEYGPPTGNRTRGGTPTGRPK